MHESMGNVDFETLLICVSALVFLLFFTAIAFCLTDYKLCYYKATNQKIFADEVISNTLALEREREEQRKISEEELKSEEILKDLESNIRIVQERYERDDTVIVDDNYKENDVIMTEIVSGYTPATTDNHTVFVHKRSDTVGSIVKEIVGKVGSVGSGDQWAIPVTQELSAMPSRERKISQISDV